VRTAVVLGALVLDRALGQPALHPVSGIGWLLERAHRRRRAGHPVGAFVEGLAALTIAAGASALVANAARRLLVRVTTDRWLRLAEEAGLMHPALALEALIVAGTRVSDALRSGDLVGARAHLGRDLVSRPTADLSPDLVAAAAIESLSENLSDSVIAPACAHLAGGLAGAWAYRAVNTADAMFGYQTDDLFWFGKPAARADDMLNLLPARLSALLLVGAAGLNRSHLRAVLGALPAEAGRTASPNAGWPMAAAALLLGVRLKKVGAYVLNPGGRNPTPDDIDKIAALLRRATWRGVGLACACEVAVRALLLSTKRSSRAQPGWGRL